MSKIILASASPRRKDLLEQAGMEFEILPSHADESTDITDPRQFVMELSARKALDIAKKNGYQDIVLGADTVVVLKDQIMGKPADEEDAVKMLKQLQGNTHQVYTGVTLVWDKDKKSNFYEVTDVHMYPMTDEEIETYVSTGEPLDKAGAYGIQGKSAVYIRGISGDYNNVVGLPIARVYQELKNQN